MSNPLIENYGEMITLREFSAGTYTGPAGTYVDGPVKESKILAVVTPFTLREMSFLPEGQNNNQWVNIYSEEKLQTAIQKDEIRADRIVWRDDEYEIVRSTDRYQMETLGHFKAQAMLYQGVK